MKLNVQGYLKCWLLSLASQVQLWHNWFKEGREDINDDARPGRPSTSKTDENIEAVKKMILDSRWITISERLLMTLAYRSAHAKQFFRIF